MATNPIFGQAHSLAGKASPLNKYHDMASQGYGRDLSATPIVSIPVGIGGILVSSVEIVAAIIVVLGMILIFPACCCFETPNVLFNSAVCVVSSRILLITAYAAKILWANTLGLLCIPCCGVPGSLKSN